MTLSIHLFILFYYFFIYHLVIYFYHCLSNIVYKKCISVYVEILRLNNSKNLATDHRESVNFSLFVKEITKIPLLEGVFFCVFFYELKKGYLVGETKSSLEGWCVCQIWRVLLLSPCIYDLLTTFLISSLSRHKCPLSSNFIFICKRHIITYYSSRYKIHDYNWVVFMLIKFLVSLILIFIGLVSNNKFKSLKTGLLHE